MSSGKHLGKGSALPVLPKDGQLILYSMRYCPYAERVHLVLDAKNIPYHTVFINLTEKPEWLVEKSSLLKVPALEMQGQAESLIESLIISDYLDEKYPEVKLHAADPLQKARNRILVERFDAFISSYYPLQNQTFENRSTAIENYFEKLDLFEVELAKRESKFFGGANAGMVDYMIWPWCERMEALVEYVGDEVQLNRVRFAKLLEWREAMKCTEAVKRNIIEPKVYKEFYSSRNSGSPNYDLLA